MKAKKANEVNVSELEVESGEEEESLTAEVVSQFLSQNQRRDQRAERNIELMMMNMKVTTMIGMMSTWMTTCCSKKQSQVKIVFIIGAPKIDIR